MTAQRFRRLGASALTILLLAAAGWYLARHWTDVTAILGRLGWELWVGVGLLRLVSVGCAVAAGHALLRTRTPQLVFSEYFVVSTASLFAAFVSPAGATLSKALYLRQRHGLTLIDFAALQLTVLLFLTGGTSLAALVGLALLSSRDVPGLAPFWMVAAGGLGCSLLPLLGHLRLFAGVAARTPRLRAALALWVASVRPALLARSVLPWVLLRAASGFLALGILFAGFSAEGSAFLVGATVDGITATLNLIRITPGNLGPYEWAVSFLGHHFGLSLTAALTAALAYRVLALAAAGIASALILAGRRLHRSAEVKRPEQAR